MTTRTLLEALWDDRPPEQARKSIQAYVSRLRRVLRQVGSAALIATKHDGYMLLAGGDEIDYLRFKMLLNQGRTLRRENRLDASAHVLYEAINLWQGPPIADLRTGWVERRREDLESYDRLAAYQELCAVQLERRDYQDTLKLLDEAMPGHELDTKYIGQRLTALDGAGEYAEFDTYWHRVYDETVRSFGTGPARELQDLHGRLLRSRDGLVPWRRAHPALADIRRPPAQLPAAINEFIGRKAELERLDQALMHSRVDGSTGTLILAVTGPVGVGKTELALHWAHGVKEQFPYAQLYADLAGYSAGDPFDPSAVLADFLLALDVPPTEIPEGIVTRGALFRTILNGRNALLFLDNARDSEQVRPLLPGSGECVVVVTSRHRLTDLVIRHGAYRIPVAPLALDESSVLVQRILLRTGMRTGGSLLDALVKISMGLPQVIRSAVEIVVDRLEKANLGRVPDRAAAPSMRDILVHGEGAQHSLGASLMWSCRAVSAGAARIFFALGRCPCSSIEEGALVALSDSLTNTFRDDMDALVSLHLVGYDGGRCVVHDMHRRFSEEYGDEFLSDADFTTAMAGMSAWYEQCVVQASAVLFARRVDLPDGATLFPDRAAAATWLATELPNLVALVRFSAGRPQPYAWRIPALLRDYLAVRKLWGEWKTLHEWGLAAAEALNDADAEIDMLNGVAIAFGKAGKADDGLRYVERALTCRAADRRNVAKAESLRVRAGLYRDAGKTGLAYTDYRAAISVVEATDRQRLAAILCEFALVCADLGRLDEAAAVLGRALAIHDELDDLVGKSATLTSLAQLCHRRGYDDDAEEFCTRVLELRGNEALGYADSLFVLVILAEISCARADFGPALDYARQALILCHTPQDHRLAARAMVCNVTALVGEDRLDDARMEAKHAIALISDIDPGSTAETRAKFESLGVFSQGS